MSLHPAFRLNLAVICLFACVPDWPAPGHCTKDECGESPGGTGTSGTGSSGGTSSSTGTDGTADAGDASASVGESTRADSSTSVAASGESSAATADGSTGSTGESMVDCGNGLVEAAEECDDGDPIADNGCDNTCAADVRVFVSSIAYKAGDLDGVHLADATCFNRAADAGLADPLRFKAFLSDSTTDARDRFVHGRGRLVMVNGLVLADSWDALLAGDLQAPLEVTETSETYHGKVWTGTQPDGTAVPGSSHCADWTSNSVLDSAYYGYSDEISGEWLLADQLDNPAQCAITFAVYCFEKL